VREMCLYRTFFGLSRRLSTDLSPKHVEAEYLG
jgi:hypothetical protein